MIVEEYVPLAPLTTFGVGGNARFFIKVHTEKEIEEAVAYARMHGLSLYPLGGGSNILVPDEGVNGLVMKMVGRDKTIHGSGDQLLIVANAGVTWEDVVEDAVAQHLFGIENLAGIPGTLGGAAVQNIGAYGTEFSNVFEYADVFNILTGSYERISHAQASFAYRSSIFKEHRELVVVRVALRLVKNAVPTISYPDLVHAQLEGVSLKTPIEIARTVRAIRSKKFPQSKEGGTAGSFFKNPVVTRKHAESIAIRFPTIPMFPQKDGAVKIPLAWILDKVLSLKGFSNGNARVYEKQPLVIVAGDGTRVKEIDDLARKVEELVYAATSIRVEREVETFCNR